VSDVRPYPRIDRLPAGEIHAVGAAGLETAAMVRYLVEGGRSEIVLHDSAADLDRAFAAAHRFQPADQRVRARRALARCRELRTGSDYLAGVDRAAAVLIPVAWFLHAANTRLGALRDRFVTYPDACFDVWCGPVVGVTGSYGKTTTTRFAAALAGGVCCGNDRESFFDLGALAAEPPGRVMAFEASNRHLHNGFRRVLEVGVLTGITLNHELDHGSFAAYRQVKYSLAGRCHNLLYHASIPASFPDAAVLAARGTAYGAGGAWRLAGGTVESPDGNRHPLPGAAGLSQPDRDNALAAAAAAVGCGVAPEDMARRSRFLSGVLPLYRHASAAVAGRAVVNDAASCLPAATAALVAGLDRTFVLICGGDRQRYQAGEFDGLARAVAGNPHARRVYALGPMAGHLVAALRAAGFAAADPCEGLEQAVERALRTPAEVVAFSPGCGTGAEFPDKYARGEAFDRAIANLVPAGQAAH
jgi:UDP-N-acetylmuramoylalanine-D-glutamate ligase